MFGLKQLFSAFARLVSSVNQTAELFDRMNRELESRMRLDEDALPQQLDAHGQLAENEVVPTPNGRRKTRGF